MVSVSCWSDRERVWNLRTPLHNLTQIESIRICRPCLRSWFSAVVQVEEALLAMLGMVLLEGTANGRFPANEPLVSDELPPINAEAAKVIAVTLVENICPDVANGELSWPPEEHAKTTVERDIHIRRCFKGNPVLFHLLRVVAAGRPALCYCSSF